MNVNEAVARVAAGAVAVGAVTGSTSALLNVASDAGMSPAWTLPLSLDGAALVAVVAIRRRRRNVLAWAALISATGVSATVQWLTAPDGAVNHLAHVVPPVAVLVAFELFLMVASPEPGPGVEAGLPDVDPVLTDAPVLEAHVGERETAPRCAVPRSSPAGREPTPQAAVARPTPAADPTAGDLLPAARAVVADLGRIPGRPTLVKHLRDSGHEVGTKKAEALLAALREEAAPDLTPVLEVTR